MAIVCAMEQQQLDSLPIQATDIQKATMQDPILSQVYSYTLNGWPNTKFTRHPQAIFQQKISNYNCKQVVTLGY